MSKPLDSNLSDADMKAAPKGLLRASRRAKELARQTKTPLVIVRNGQLFIENVGPDESHDR